ncbi:MAG: hypothetical protein LBC88_09870 [Spirochaetaceae bacterium]|jgi:hypothetical protein|nr:hypothetical protein [Spirochaetaceae bacterium]
MKRFLFAAVWCCFACAGMVFAQFDDLPGDHMVALISDTYGAPYESDTPLEALWYINQGYGFGISLDALMAQNAKIRFMGKLTIDGKETSISMMRQSCIVYMQDRTPITYIVTYFVDETASSPGGPQRGYFAVRIEVRCSKTDYIERKFELLVSEVNRKFTGPISPVSGHNGSYYEWSVAPTMWRQWPMEVYYYEPGRITYYHFSQLGQCTGQRSQRYSVQTLYNWIISSR